MERRNHNIRFNMQNEEAKKAWEYLHSKEVEEDFKSLNAFVIIAINDYYERYLKRKADSYFETREKEDAFAERMVQTKRRRKWKCHGSGSSIFLTIWQARGTTCLYHPHHIGRNRYAHSAEKPMWEICFERGAKSIFRLSGEIFPTDRKRGMMCTAHGEQL